MSENKLEGWVWAANWNKAHYVKGSRSLCGKWMYLNKDPKMFEQGNDESPDNCTACKKALAKLRAQQKVEELKEKGKVEL